MNFIPTVFLDFDGVLNGSKNYVRWDRSWHEAIGRGMSHNPPEKLADDPFITQLFDTDMIERVNMITRHRNAVVIISSSWRNFHPYEQLKTLLYGVGLNAPIVGTTPRGMNRWDAILSRRDSTMLPTTPFLILDDDATDYPTLCPNLVRTKTHVGITDEDVERALQIWEVQLGPKS